VSPNPNAHPNPSTNPTPHPNPSTNPNSHPNPSTDPTPHPNPSQTPSLILSLSLTLAVGIGVAHRVVTAACVRSFSTAPQLEQEQLRWLGAAGCERRKGGGSERCAWVRKGRGERKECQRRTRRCLAADPCASLNVRIVFSNCHPHCTGTRGRCGHAGRRRCTGND